MLFRRLSDAPEIKTGSRGEIDEGGPDGDGLVELPRIDLVERIVGGVMGVEIIEAILAQ